MKRVGHLLQAAVSFRDANIGDAIATPEAFDTLHDAIQHMNHVLWYDAKHAMQAPISHIPDDPMLHTVDMDGDEPGIVSTTKPRVQFHHMSRTSMHKRQPGDVAPPLASNDDGSDAEDDEVPVARAYINRPAASARGPTAVKAQQKALLKAERAAIRDEENDRKVLEKLEEKERQRLERANETAEERAERLVRQREERAEKKRQKEAEKAATEDRDPDGEGDDELEDRDQDVSSVDPTASKRKKKRRVLTPDDMDAACTVPHHSILPRPMRVSQLSADTNRVFANPVPSDRHIEALSKCGMRTGPLLDALLRGTPTAKLVCIQGPPGTGKTNRLIDTLCATSFRRALVCAHSNVAVVGLYERLLSSKCADDVSLCVPPARVPDGVVVSSDDPRKRIVCATVSSRASPHMDDVSFDAIFIDEAAQLSEALTWTLMRPDVETVVMAGDIKQLRALAPTPDAQTCHHDRSLMERLLTCANYPATVLTEQRRMHPHICAFPNGAFYEDSLTTHPSCGNLDEVDADQVYTCRRIQGECVSSATSFHNDAEVDACVDIVRNEKAAGRAPTSMVVLCPYQNQCRRLLTKQMGVPVHTIDSFQGREADVVIVSMVRTGDECGFWNDPRRLVVALTRARKRLYIVGSFDWTQAPLQQMTQDAKRRAVLT